MDSGLPAWAFNSHWCQYAVELWRNYVEVGEM